MKPTILVDVDGVLVDWSSQFPHFLEQKGLPHEKAIMGYAHSEWQTVEDLVWLPLDEATSLVEEYTCSEFMKRLTPYKDALLAVNQLKHIYDFVAVTAISNDPQAHQNRTENLEFWFPGAFSKVHCVGMGGNKLEILSKYDSTVWIDDSPGHIREGLMAGHKCIRLVRDSRMNQVPSFTASNWAELTNLILQLVPTR